MTEYWQNLLPNRRSSTSVRWDACQPRGPCQTDGMTVHQMRKFLTQPVEIQQVEGVQLRTYQGDDDIPRWLELRRAAFARQRLGVRDWTPEDFRREFLAKPWWNPGHLWLATLQVPIASEPGKEAPPVGTVALAWRGVDRLTPAVHWMAVLPAWRRRGVARLLLSALEARVWELGCREVWLETHAAWQAAVRFYQAAGYEVHE